MFNKPEGVVLLWRERAFDVMLDGQWVSGVFDRVVVCCNNQNKPLSATIYDFKTDQGLGSEIESRYSLQMKVYRNAVAKLLALNVEAVKAKVVSIR